MLIYIYTHTFPQIRLKARLMKNFILYNCLEYCKYDYEVTKSIKKCINDINNARKLKVNNILLVLFVIFLGKNC